MPNERVCLLHVVLGPWFTISYPHWEFIPKIWVSMMLYVLLEKKRHKMISTLNRQSKARLIVTLSTVFINVHLE